MEFVKPNRLKAGDTVASLSPSWGGPAIFPRIYELGVRNLKANFHLQIKEYPTTRGDPELLHGNPEMRAKDVNSAFSDREVAGIISSIGGDDSIRILSYLSKEAIKSNPKVLMGYSDTTTLLSYCNQLGLVTFHGPSIMAGFSQMENLPATSLPMWPRCYFTQRRRISTVRSRFGQTDIPTGPKMETLERSTLCTRTTVGDGYKECQL